MSHRVINYDDPLLAHVQQHIERVSDEIQHSINAHEDTLKALTQRVSQLEQLLLRLYSQPVNTRENKD